VLRKKGDASVLHLKANALLRLPIRGGGREEERKEIEGGKRGGHFAADAEIGEDVPLGGALRRHSRESGGGGEGHGEAGRGALKRERASEVNSVPPKAARGADVTAESGKGISSAGGQGKKGGNEDGREGGSYVFFHGLVSFFASMRKGGVLMPVSVSIVT
jgi:hypothetical protein